MRQSDHANIYTLAIEAQLEHNRVPEELPWWPPPAASNWMKRQIYQDFSDQGIYLCRPIPMLSTLFFRKPFPENQFIHICFSLTSCHLHSWGNPKRPRSLTFTAWFNHDHDKAKIQPHNQQILVPKGHYSAEWIAVMFTTGPQFS